MTSIKLVIMVSEIFLYEIKLYFSKKSTHFKNSEMEKLKQGWNYGTTKRTTKKEDEAKLNEQKKGMTVREHMTQ